MRRRHVVCMTIGCTLIFAGLRKMFHAPDLYRTVREAELHDALKAEQHDAEEKAYGGPVGKEIPGQQYGGTRTLLQMLDHLGVGHPPN